MQESDVKIAHLLVVATLRVYDEEKFEREMSMPQYAEAVLEQNLSIEVASEQSSGFAPEASGATLLIAKRQAIIDRIARERADKPQAKFDWRELLKDAEVTLDEARQKLATRVLEQVGVDRKQREATHASLFLDWFAAGDRSVLELTVDRPWVRPSMYRVVRELTPAVIDPAFEPNYSIDPTIIHDLSVPIEEPTVRPRNVPQSDPLPSVPEDWGINPVRLGIPGLRHMPEVDDSDPESWRLDALCAQTDPEAFFPEKGGSTRDAKRICTTCDVKLQCLDYALQNDERFGIWGGLSERERRKLRRSRSN